jgi:plasmid stabilization system protein ParE
VSRGYRLTSEAQADVDEICEFIAQDSVDAALRVLDAFEHAFNMLAGSPEIGHTREDLTARPLKFWGVYSFLLVYDPASAPLSIIAVLRGARDVERRLKNAPP